ncbi:hypothetical protein DB41_GZ00440 [Neochlamydia sp. TUME1]|nr:hypothetical protein DB41_GZ00440 [Neochlamydia sp. TUME1]
MAYGLDRLIFLRQAGKLSSSFQRGFWPRKSKSKHKAAYLILKING